MALLGEAITGRRGILLLATSASAISQGLPGGFRGLMSSIARSRRYRSRDLRQVRKEDPEATRAHPDQPLLRGLDPHSSRSVELVEKRLGADVMNMSVASSPR